MRFIWKEYGFLGQLKQEYLDKVHPVIRLQIYQAGTELEQSLRHLYYTDASRYFSFGSRRKLRSDVTSPSINYLSEFGRQMKLLGEIPRRTMIRHLLLFGMPFINRRLISCRLEHFGYLPLSPDHTQVDGKPSGPAYLAERMRAAETYSQSLYTVQETRELSVSVSGRRYEGLNGIAEYHTDEAGRLDLAVILDFCPACGPGTGAGE